MHPVIFILILILFFFSTGGTNPINVTTYTILLAGESNMAGRGGVNGTWDRFIPPESLPANPDSVIRLSPELRWEPATEPLHHSIDITVDQDHLGIGPGMAFATALLRRVDPSNTGTATVALVPAAMGDSGILRWQSGNSSAVYLNLLVRAEAAALSFGPIAGMLWYQGESDTVSPQLAAAYGPRLRDFFNSIRADLAMPQLPIIQVALASGILNRTAPADLETVRSAQLGLRMARVRCVDAMGLKLESNDTHLTTAAQVKLGQLMADAFLQPW
ncbi:Probable carbohydrate esterase [Striga hermonthica]|uniref:Probable carbohydrate esterase n=1 Tax=Striga hermonthica TaxID=68872 RepID=A0A9N7MS67_STRHE|nr:Probable carbohydrate esterase [Striga hermonthica]